MLRNNQVEVEMYFVIGSINMPTIFIPHKFPDNTRLLATYNPPLNEKEFYDVWKPKTYLQLLKFVNYSCWGWLTLGCVGSKLWILYLQGLSSSLGACAFCLAAVGAWKNSTPGNCEKKTKENRSFAWLKHRFFFFFFGRFLCFWESVWMGTPDIMNQRLSRTDFWNDHSSLMFHSCSCWLVRCHLKEPFTRFLHRNDERNTDKGENLTVNPGIFQEKLLVFNAKEKRLNDFCKLFRYLLVQLFRDQTPRVFSPQNVAFWKGTPRLFQGGS